MATRGGLSELPPHQRALWGLLALALLIVPVVLSILSSNPVLGLSECAIGVLVGLGAFLRKRSQRGTEGTPEA